MPVCSRCGAESPDGFRFCGACGAPLDPPAADAGETRRTVTVVFCDVTGSTAVGERLDPESFRRVMARYFAAMRAVVERHGGEVEKFIGDAVMAVFGVPRLHEDDALRAVRAADEMRAAMATLNGDLERDFGTTLALRTGINTGTVVTGTAERLATGDAVNVAARLEQAAAPGEILIGRETLALVRDAVSVEPLPPLALKGKREPVRAYRLLAVASGAAGLARSLDTPLVGRQRELRLLTDAWDRVVSERACALFTVLGAAGVGKSRLTAEFLARIDAAIARGRCLPYGEGITYWPVVEAVTQLVGADGAGLVALDLDPHADAAIRSLLGIATVATPPHETRWAVRKLFEAVARARPLAVVFDDVHWGEPTFLELVEHVADLSRGAPILLLCIARPELRDRAPAWGGGLLNATTLLLEPLSPAETDELIERLPGRTALDASARRRIHDAAEGNPLFVEQMLALQQETGVADVVVPPTIHALLAARLDQLDAGERRALERGSVEGKVFHRGAVQALAPEETELDARLAALVRSDLVRPDRATLAGDEAFRFRHLLIRDAAYDALPKATRAELHERFAGWVDEHGADLLEREEIVGYHLEQAYRYRAELGPLGAADRALGRRAGERLRAAGRAAFDRGDMPAASSLLARAAALFDYGDHARAETLVALGEAQFFVGDLAAAAATLDEAVADARALGDERLEAVARMRRLRTAAQIETAFRVSDIEPELEKIARVFERLDDHHALAEAIALSATMRFYVARAGEAIPLMMRAADHARRAGDRRLESGILARAASAMAHGPTPAGEALAFADDLLARAAQDVPGRALTLSKRGWMLAMEGRFREARESAGASRAMALEFGLHLRRGELTMDAGEIELLAGDPMAAEAVLREGRDLLDASGEAGFRATVTSILAESLRRQRRLDEADRLADEVAGLASDDDFDALTRARAVRAEVHAERGAHAEAERLAREAVTLAEPTDYTPLKADTALALARVLRATGADERAAEAARRALALHEAKGNVVSAAVARALLDELTPAPRAS